MRKLFCAVLVLVGTSSLPADITETPQQRDARMAWWRNAKFGLFIHWGVYAVPAGIYRGQQIPGIGEWIMYHAKIPVAEYRAFARQFNPTKYDPNAWAALAKEAGMKYIVITAKHHDGFALFPSDVTDWDVADATPYGKDLIGPLAQAARRHGLRFGTYYSQAQDWTHRGGAKARYKEGDGWDDAHKGSFDDYLRKIAIPQTREILTRIQPDILWWDTPAWMTLERAKPLHDLIALRPGLITNNRLGGGFKGDTETPEQHIPATGFKDRDWETCMTMNDTWGYKSYDHNWKSTETLIRNLVDIVSKGGNYLLNVGPTAEGEIPAPSVQRLKEIGAWLKRNGAAIYGTTASPFTRLTWGRCTKKINNRGGILYLHVFEWPADGQLTVPGLRSRVTSARLLANGQRLKFTARDGAVLLAVPGLAPDAPVSVIELQFTGALDVERRLPRQQADGRIVLTAEWADIHNSLRAHARLAAKGSNARITQWNSHESRVSWNFLADKPGSYTVTAEISGTGGGRLNLILNNTSVPAEVPAGAGAERRRVRLGTVTIPSSGESVLELKPATKSWTGFDLYEVILSP